MSNTKEAMQTYTKQKQQTLFQALRWVATAISTDESRYILTFAKKEGDLLIATDGKRLHKLKSNQLTEWEDGLYKVIKNTAKEIIFMPFEGVGNFPNWAQAIPVYGGGSEKQLIKSCSSDHITAKLCHKSGAMLPDKFARDASGAGTLCARKMTPAMQVQYQEGYPVTITHECDIYELEAVVMGLSSDV